MNQFKQLGNLSNVQNLSQQIKREFDFLKRNGKIISKSELDAHLVSIDQAADMLNKSWQLMQSSEGVDDNIREDIVDIFVTLADIKKDLLTDIKYINN